MRKISDDGLQLIKDYEGFSAVPYLCPGGYWTIGYGHVISVADRAKYAAGISLQQAGRLLGQDVGVAERAVLRLINVPLTDGQFDALVSFTFNLGAGALQRSTLRRKINREEYDDAAEEFHRWVWAGGRRLRGLVKRRAAEAALFGA